MLDPLPWFDTFQGGVDASDREVATGYAAVSQTVEVRPTCPHNPLNDFLSHPRTSVRRAQLKDQLSAGGT